MASTTPTTPRENTSPPEQSTTPAAKVVELTGLDTVMDALAVAAEDKKLATQLYDDLAGIIKARMGTAEIGTLGGQPVVSYTQTERIILRDKLVRELHPDVARECEDIIPVRTFRLLNP
ncbi:hypothetical protein JOF56_005742 [Kibdelosporangium banguiense]|uniref:Uncharacterized protein n=1 Tax=Kibdelosporangium banguiense TaxID=1365924 RepID=A0ABS4TLQ4_9PSEU|nr:hypothetical protein [Kibdelosporangium banguiense]MBP2325357.1 hypothetical protein [Kibdelosporangium banguiense]